MTRKWVDRQIDEALLLVATQAGFLYAQRRARRLMPKVVVGTAVVTGVGAAAATVAVGVGVLGLTGGAVAWYRYRTKSGSAAPTLETNWRPAGSGGPSATAVGSKSADSPAENAASDPAAT